MDRDPDDRLTTKQVAEALGVAPSTVWRWPIRPLNADSGTTKRSADRIYRWGDVTAYVLDKAPRTVRARLSTTDRIAELENRVTELSRRLDAHELGHA